MSPCRYCGNLPVLYSEEDEDVFSLSPIYKVQCTSHECPKNPQTLWHGTKSEAVKEWDRIGGEADED